MQLIIIIIFILVIFIFLMSKTSEKSTSYELNDTTEYKEKKENKILKMIYSIVLFIPIFIAYYFIIAFISAIPLFFILGAESGGWVFAMLLGFVLAPIFTIITIVKVIYKKKVRIR